MKVQIAITAGLLIIGTTYLVKFEPAVDPKVSSHELISKVSHDLKNKCQNDGVFRPVHDTFKTNNNSYNLNINEHIADIQILRVDGSIVSTKTFKCIDHNMEDA